MIINKSLIYNNIDQLISQNISFVIYRLPGQDPVLLIDQTEQNQIVNSLDELNNTDGFLFAPFKQSAQNPILCIHPSIRIEGEAAIGEYLHENILPASDNQEINRVEEFTCTDYFPSYQKAFGAFSDALQSSQFEKLVLSRPYNHKISEHFSPARAFTKALNLYQSAFVYLCHTPHSGTWLGSTPELLVSGQNSEWRTVALAGTQKVNTERDTYAWDEKNTYEQELVSDYLRQQFHKFGVSFTEGNPHSIKAGELVHLQTDFTFKLKNASLIDSLINMLHPTPAICGTPREEAYNFILANEGYDRSYYSGVIGNIDKNGRTDLFINLRCMQIHANHLTMYAGGGLLKSSELESEWDETERKLKTMLSLVN